jgi:hypothetical protein
MTHHHSCELDACNPMQGNRFRLSANAINLSVKSCLGGDISLSYTGVCLTVICRYGQTVKSPLTPIKYQLPCLLSSMSRIVSEDERSLSRTWPHLPPADCLILLVTDVPPVKGTPRNCIDISAWYVLSQTIVSTIITIRGEPLTRGEQNKRYILSTQSLCRRVRYLKFHMVCHGNRGEGAGEGKLWMSCNIYQQLVK